MDFITLLDGIVITVVLLSALLAMYRGFIREVLSIAAWVAAAAAAFMFHKPLLPFIKPYLAQVPDTIAIGISAVSIFILTLLVVSYITMKISDFVLDSAFGPLDRSFGFLFGAARGLLLLVVAMLFFNWFVPDRQPAWVAGAKSKPLLDFMGQRLVSYLPDDPETKIFDALKRRPQNQDEPADGDQPATPPAPVTPPGQQRS
jgi:membrane protein required for colicin V production